VALDAVLNASTTDDDDGNTPAAFSFSPLTDQDFNSLEFGFRSRVGGQVVTLRNIFAEVLGAGAPVEEIEFVSGEAEIGLTWSTLVPKPLTALMELNGQEGITLHQSAGFAIATVRERDRSVARYMRLDDAIDPEAVKGRILATQKQLREIETIDYPPQGFERQRLASAYHEAGHGTAALSLGLGVQRSTIVPGQWARGVFGGETAYDLPEPDPAPQLTLIRMALALRVGPLTPTTLLGHACEQFGGADGKQIDAILSVLNVTDPAAVWNALTAVARSFLHVARHAAQIEAVATALLERKTLRGDEISTVCAANGVPVEPWTIQPIEELSRWFVSTETVIGLQTGPIL
jgi:hypothetical protein